jgi:hypothetical protein
MSTTEVVEGLLRPDGTLELARRATLPPGRVRVTMEQIQPSAKQDVWTVLERIWHERQTLGMRGRTRAEIDAQIRAGRDEWDDGAARDGRQPERD